MGRARLALGIAIGAAVGALLRGAVLEVAPPSRLVGDENYYVEVAYQIARGHGHYSSLYGAHAAWPPLYPAFLSLFIRADTPELPPEDRRRLLHAQLGLGVALVVATGLLGRALFDDRTALAATAAAALYPALIGYSHYFWSETLFALLLTLGLAAAVGLRARGGAGAALLCGVLFGLAALTREVGLLVACACGAWWVASAPRAARWRASGRAALLLAGALAAIAPWSLRNHGLFERTVPVSTVGWLALRDGNTLPVSGWLGRDAEASLAFHRAYFGTADEMQRMELARREALARIRQEQPLWAAKKLARAAVFLFHPGSFVFFKLSSRGYVDLPLSAVRCALVASALAWAALLLGAGLALPGVPGPGRRLFAPLVLAAGLGVHVLANASTRYRLPLVPLLLVYAAWALSHPGRAWAGLRGAGWLAPAAAALLLVAGGAYFAPDAASLWTRGVLTGTRQP